MDIQVNHEDLMFLAEFFPAYGTLDVHDRHAYEQCFAAILRGKKRQTPVITRTLPQVQLSEDSVRPGLPNLRLPTGIPQLLAHSSVDTQLPVSLSQRENDSRQLESFLKDFFGADALALLESLKKAERITIKLPRIVLSHFAETASRYAIAYALVS